LYCPGETCEPRKKQAIQKVSYMQLFILLGFVVFVYLAAVFLNGYFSQAPDNLFRIIRSL
jgi:hypothetical protein